MSEQVMVWTRFVYNYYIYVAELSIKFQNINTQTLKNTYFCSDGIQNPQRRQYCLFLKI